MTDTNERLRALGERLDAAAPPLTAAELTDGGRARQSVSSPAPWRTIAVGCLMAAAVVVAVLAVVRTDGGDTSSVRTTPSDDAETAPEPVSTSTEVTTTTAPAVATTSGAPAVHGLPGEQVEIYPHPDAELAVVGVSADDLLNVRAGPGTQFPVVFTLEPLAEGAVATGHNRLVAGTEMWVELRWNASTGWARSTFLLQPGQVTDVTSRLYPDPASRPSAEDLADLAETVGRSAGAQEPPPRITIVDGPHVGDLGEVTVDVVGLADDSVGGVRLKIFAHRAADGFVLRAVEETLLCSRGVTDGGLCL